MLLCAIACTMHSLSPLYEARGILPKSSSSFDPTTNVTHGCPMKRVAANGCKYFTFKIPYSKTKQFAGDWIESMKYSNLVDPVSAIEHHLFLSRLLPSHAPLFAYQTSMGWALLSREFFIKCCQEIWKTAGLEDLLGHGFHIGGTTYLLLCGVDPWIVMKLG